MAKPFAKVKPSFGKQPAAPSGFDAISRPTGDKVPKGIFSAKKKFGKV